MQANFEVFYTAFMQTAIYVYCLANSSNEDAKAWLNEWAPAFITDFTTLHDHWNAMIDELQPPVDANAIAELTGIASDANMEFSFDGDGKIVYI
jgi:hypothetical protein